MATRIRSAMEEEGDTYRSLARRAGVSSGTVSNILSAKDPRLLTLIRVASALGFPSLEAVFGDIDLPTRSLLLEVSVAAEPKDT